MEHRRLGIELAAHDGQVRVSVRDDGVGCEACHGPGANHVLNTADRTRIVNPSRLTAAAFHPAGRQDTRGSAIGALSRGPVYGDATREGRRRPTGTTLELQLWIGGHRMSAFTYRIADGRGGAGTGDDQPDHLRLRRIVEQNLARKGLLESVVVAAGREDRCVHRQRQRRMLASSGHQLSASSWSPSATPTRG